VVVTRGRGVVTDPAVHAEVVERIEDALRRSGCAIAGWVDSPILGAEGNRELLVHATVGSR
jgi:23S rRNA (cytidine1920-2'-O)/16S rRNA (cytidine1409-2'-O)-methyltransferase